MGGDKAGPYQTRTPACGRQVGIRWDTAYKWIDAKQMLAHRIGRLRKFRKEDGEVGVW